MNLRNVLLTMAACAAIVGLSAGRTLATPTYAISVGTGNLSIPVGWYQSMYITETTSVSTQPPALTLQAVGTGNGIVFGPSQLIFTSSVKRVYQVSVTVASSFVGQYNVSEGPFYFTDSAGTVVTQTFGVTPLIPMAAWSVVNSPVNINPWILFPSVDFFGKEITVDTPYTTGTTASAWTPFKWITIPTLGNNAPVLRFDLEGTTPCAPLVQVYRNGSPLNYAESTQYSTQWSFRTYLPNVQAGDIVQLYAISDGGGQTTNNYYELGY